MLTFVLGALAVEGAIAAAIAIAIVALAVQSQGMALGAFTRNVKRFEL